MKWGTGRAITSRCSICSVADSPTVAGWARAGLIIQTDASPSIRGFLLQRPHLDRERGRACELRTPLERRVQVGGPDDRETADVPLGLRERPVRAQGRARWN